MGEFSPSYMIDCSECGSQNWCLLSLTESNIRVECDECGITASYVLSDETMGADCLICAYDTWTLLEYIEEEHLMLECDNCSEIAEIWLRGDQS